MRTQTPAHRGTRTLDRSYPGAAEHIQRVRRDVAALLGNCPIADDVLLVVSELATNATVHSLSGSQGGLFSIRVTVCAGDYVWAEIEDQGGPWNTIHHGDDRPHGLDIVAVLAGDGDWGIDGDEQSGRTVWVRLDWTHQP